MGLLCASASAQLSWSSMTSSPIQWREYKSGLYGGVPVPRQLVMNTGAQWQRYWSEITGELPQSAPDDISWPQEQLIAIHIGQRPSAGYEVAVESIQTVRPGEIVVRYVEVTPAPGQMVAKVITSPWVVVRMNRAPGVVRFEGRTQPGPIARRIPGRCCDRCTGIPSNLVIGYLPVQYPKVMGDPFNPLYSIQWRTHSEGSESNIDRSRTQVLVTEGDWQKYWSESTGQPPHLAPKGADWNKEQLIAIHVPQLRPGSKVMVESIERVSAATIQVSYLVLTAPSRTAVTEPTNPWVVVRMDRSPGSLQFKRQDIAVPEVPPVRCDCGCSTCPGR
ncbi:MAG: protease complex subunit PrcB family protein [Armatimonadetes bacterium]|nr:MAG: protease complex subunit PrcB family protein [Armatimonadota bacterium]